MMAEPPGVVSSPSVPIEIVRAAGFRPVVVQGSSAPTPAADAHLEPRVFPSRLRQLVEAALTGGLSGAGCVVLPRTSDVDYKCFLYLREFLRRGVVPALPPIILFDLLQSDGPGARDHAVTRTRTLCEELGAVSGRRTSADALHHEIGRANVARAAARRVSALRRGVPRVTGNEVFPLLSAFWRMDPEDYVAMAGEAARDIATREPLAAPRVLLAGAPVDTPLLHAAIEAHGATVCAEIGPWGSGGPGDDVRVDQDPVAALADKYRTDTVSPRTPGDTIRRLIEQEFDDVDAVVVSLPPDDAVFGWDYPALRDRLRERSIPHVRLCGDPYQPLAASDQGRLDDLVMAARHNDARHG